MGRRDITLFRYHVDLEERAEKRNERTGRTAKAPGREEHPVAQTFREEETGQSSTVYLTYLVSVAVAAGLAFGGYKGYRWWQRRGTDEEPTALGRGAPSPQPRRSTDRSTASLVGFLFLLGTAALVRRLRLSDEAVTGDNE